MENTLENKAKLFAQYWGQNIAKEYDTDLTITVNPEICRWTRLWFLILKPISSITDEDAEIIAKHYEENAHDIQISSGQIVFDFYYGDIIQSAAIDFSLDYCVDYLRSKGYALPYMGLSVEKQIEYGWVKLS